jgi:hypothetical protein
VSRTVETLSVILIAVAILFGGRFLLFGIAQHHGFSLVILAVLFVLQSATVRRNRARGGPLVQLRATRDVAFLATIILTFLVVLSPQRWSIGATIAALEFALVIDILSRFTPVPRT